MQKTALTRAVGNTVAGKARALPSVPVLQAEMLPSLSSRLTIQRIRNDENETKFFSLKKISLRDKENFYLYHGTFEDNLEGIGKTGMDPRQGGQGRGSQRYEKKNNSDSTGLVKFTTDPEIAMIYAKEPALIQNDPKVGAFLEVRVKQTDLLSLFNDRTYQGDPNPFWRRERGGENSRVIEGMPPEILALNSQGEPGEKNYIRALETNTKIEPKDIKLCGLYLPPGFEVNEHAIENKLRHEVEAIAIDIKTFKTSNIYTDSWLNF